MSIISCEFEEMKGNLQVERTAAETGNYQSGTRGNMHACVCVHVGGCM